MENKNCLNSRAHTLHVLNWLIQLASAINYLHEFNPNIIHRDIKPQNVLVSGDKVKLADFSLSRFGNNNKLNDSLSYSRCIGTIGYTSPEILQAKDYNESVDIWSFGCIVFEMLTYEKLSNYFLNFQYTDLPDLSVNPQLNDLNSFFKK
jgi:serine/threonine protein kinase